MNEFLILDRYDVDPENVHFNEDIGVYYIHIDMGNLSNTEFVDISSQLEENAVFYLSQKRYIAMSWSVKGYRLVIEAIDGEAGHVTKQIQRRVM